MTENNNTYDIEKIPVKKGELRQACSKFLINHSEEMTFVGKFNFRHNEAVVIDDRIWYVKHAGEKATTFSRLPKQKGE